MSQSSVRDPCQGEFTTSAGGVPHDSTLTETAVCDWNTTIYYCVYCDLQDIKGVCGDSRPQG